MSDRVNKRQAPEPAQPTGTVDVASGWAALESDHATLRAALAGCDGLALSQVTLDHPVLRDDDRVSVGRADGRP